MTRLAYERRISASHHTRVIGQTNPPIKNKQWQTSKWIFRGRSHLVPRLGGRGDIYLHKGIGSDCHRRVPNPLPRPPQTLEPTSPVFLRISSLSCYLLGKSMLKEHGSLFLKDDGSDSGGSNFGGFLAWFRTDSRGK